MTGISALLGVGEAGLWHGLVVFLRAGALMALLPGFSEQSVPVRVRLLLALALALVCAPLVPLVPGPATLPVFLRYLLSESIAGLALGLGLRSLVFALQIAGSMAAQATSLSQVFGAAGVEPLPALGHVLVVAGLALAMLFDLHVHAVMYLVQSYSLLPAGQLPDPRALSLWGIATTGQAVALAFTLAAPFVVISLLYNVTLGVINRAMPQLMVAFVGAPLITFGSIFLLWLLAPAMLGVWIEALMRFLHAPFDVVR